MGGTIPSPKSPRRDIGVLSSTPSFPCFALHAEVLLALKVSWRSSSLAPIKQHPQVMPIQARFRCWQGRAGHLPRVKWASLRLLRGPLGPL